MPYKSMLSLESPESEAELDKQFCCGLNIDVSDVVDNDEPCVDRKS